MNKEAINQLIEKTYLDLFEWIKNQPDENWTKGPEGKWTAGQHVLHLVESIQPLNKALSMPKFLLSYKFGKSNRALRDYDTVVKRYHDRLQENAGVAVAFNENLQTPTLSDREKLVAVLDMQYKKLQRKVTKWSDTNLDTYILPHPLMGRMPIREIVMWSAYHVEHHTETLKKDYS